MTRRRVGALETEFEAARAAKQRPVGVSMTAMWRGYRGGVADAHEDVDRRVMRYVA